MRKYTTMLLDMVAEGTVDKDNVIQGLLNWLSEYDVEEFMRYYEYLPDEEEEDPTLDECRYCGERCDGECDEALAGGFQEEDEEAAQRDLADYLNRVDEAHRQQAIRQWLNKPAPNFEACCCMGARDGEPDCRCMMQMYEKVNGEWYRIHEHRSPTGITHTAEKVVAKEVA